MADEVLANLDNADSGDAEFEKTAPTRPHPRTPPSPNALRAAGPVVAAADKTRDKLAGRVSD